MFLGWKEKKLSIWIKCNFNKIEMFKSYFGIVVVGSFLWKKVIKVVKIPKRKDCQMSYTWEHFYCISNRYSNIWSQSSTYYNTSPSSCPCLVWSSTVHCPCDSNLNQIWFFSGGRLKIRQFSETVAQWLWLRAFQIVHYRITLKIKFH